MPLLFCFFQNFLYAEILASTTWNYIKFYCLCLRKRTAVLWYPFLREESCIHPLWGISASIYLYWCALWRRLASHLHLLSLLFQSHPVIWFNILDLVIVWKNMFSVPSILIISGPNSFVYVCSKSALSSSFMNLLTTFLMLRY